MAVSYIIILLCGLIIGSFINVCIYRIPLGKSIVAPPSACTSCGKRLVASDLVPIFSYFLLRGRCRHCRTPISPRYPLVEFLTALVFIALFIRYGYTIPFIAFAFLMAVLIIVFFIDVDHRIIPDELVIAGIIGGAVLLGYNFFRPLTEVFGDGKWWTPVAGFFSGSGFLLLIALLGLFIYKTDDAMGMGDVKLMAPIGLFLGWRLCLTSLFISVLLAGVTSLGLILLRIKKKKDTIPFGPFIVTGTFLTIMWGWELLNWYTGLR